jgi:hypothetical protein
MSEMKAGPEAKVEMELYYTPPGGGPAQTIRVSGKSNLSPEQLAERLGVPVVVKEKEQ